MTILTRRSALIGSLATLALKRSALAAPALCRGPFQTKKIGPVNPACLAVPNGLVGYWPLSAETLDFNQGLAFDISGNNNHGMMTGLTATSLTQGPVGTALAFPGSGSVDISVPSSATSILKPQTFTIIGWVNRSSGSTTYPVVISCENFSQNKNYFFGDINADNTSPLSLRINGNAGTSHVLSETSATLNVLVHYAIQYSAGNGYLYKNAILNATSATLPTPITYDATAITLGVNLLGSESCLKIYNRLLSPAEILTDFHSSLAGSRTPFPPPERGF